MHWAPFYLRPCDRGLAVGVNLIAHTSQPGNVQNRSWDTLQKSRQKPVFSIQFKLPAVKCKQ